MYTTRLQGWRHTGWPMDAAGPGPTPRGPGHRWSVRKCNDCSWPLNLNPSRSRSRRDTSLEAGAEVCIGTCNYDLLTARKERWCVHMGAGLVVPEVAVRQWWVCVARASRAIPSCRMGMYMWACNMRLPARCTLVAGCQPSVSARSSSEMVAC